MWFLGLWNWFMEVIWKILEFWAKKILESCKQSLVVHSRKSLEDQNAEINTVSKSLAHEISDNKASIRMWV